MARFLLPLIFFAIAAGSAVLAVTMLATTPPKPPLERPLFPAAPDEPPPKRVATPELLARLELNDDAPAIAGSSIEPAILRALGQSRCVKALRPMEARLTAYDAPETILQVGVVAARRIEASAGRRIGKRILSERDDLSPSIRTALTNELK